MFLGAFAIYGAFWAIDRFSVQAQASSYYGVSFPVSSYISNSNSYTSSTSIFTSTKTLQADAVAMHILYSWFFWKFPLFVFLLELTADQKVKKLRFIPWGITVGLFLALDILLIVFVTHTVDANQNIGTWNYTDWMAFLGIFLFSFIIVGIGNIGHNVK